ncbi:unnamed protein product [Rhizoctonia solani]|uniref:Uncharacterized protein n=1 Tax=Rhizoctonia solani TaxID=456999 RepID=A0A8H3DHU2_9AGAM|nr:unnamed protein product [Rhizoctonia solani]
MPTPEETVKAFVKIAPSATYAFDGDRESNSAQLCRKKPGGGQDCIRVAMAAKELNITMQNMGYFCQLPFDPSQTHMECFPIPK